MMIPKCFICGKDDPDMSVDVLGHPFTRPAHKSCFDEVIAGMTLDFCLVDGSLCDCKLPGFDANKTSKCPTCGKPHRHSQSTSPTSSTTPWQK